MTTIVIHAIRTLDGWDSMSAAEQSAYSGYYTSLSAWEADQQRDLVAADEIAVAECYNDWPSGLSDYLWISGWTADSTRYVEVTVASGHRHDGTPESGFYLNANTNYVPGIKISTQYTRLYWMDVLADGNDQNAINNNSYSYAVIENCIGNRTGGNGTAPVFNKVNGKVRCCLAIGNGSDKGFDITYSAPAVYIDNCVAVGCSYGFVGRETKDAFRNCVAYNNTTNYGGTWDTTNSTNNATSSVTDDAPGGSSITGVSSSDFVDAANDDYHLASGSSLIGAGVNLYSEFTEDIDGDTWPATGAWDIGFDYYTSSSVIAILDTTLGTLTLSSATNINVSGVLDKTLNTLALEADASIDIIASVAKTLDTLILNANGVIEVQATVAKTLEALILTSEGTVSSNITADLDTTLANLTLTADTSIDVQAALTKILESLILTANTSVDIASALTITLSNLILSSTTSISILSFLSQTLDSLILTSDATVISEIIATLDQSLAPLVAQATAAVNIEAISNAILDSLVLASTGSIDIEATVAQTLDSLLLTADGVVSSADINANLDQSLDSLTATAIATVTITSSLAQTLDELVLSGEVSIDVEAALTKTLDSLALDSQVFTGSGIGANLDSTLSPLLLSSNATTYVLTSIRIIKHWVKDRW